MGLFYVCVFFYLQLSEMQEASNARHQRELAQVREATAREMKHYYLQCLHQLVNGNPNNTINTATNGLLQSSDVYHRPVPGYIPAHPPGSMVENLRPKSQEAYHSEFEGGDIHGTTCTAAMSTQVLRTQDSNSHAQVPAERRTRKEKGVVSGERRRKLTASQSPNRKSTSASSSVSPSRTRLVGGGTAPHHHHYRTNVTHSSSRKAVGGRLCKNHDATSSGRHQNSVHVKGEIHRSAAASGGHRGTTSSAIRGKDLHGRSSTGRQAGPLLSKLNGLPHSDGVRELKSVTGGKLKNSRR